MTIYRYSPLVGNDTIRLLRLETTTDPLGPDEIRAELVHVSLADNPSYEALSYTWGDAVFPERIVCPTGHIPITANLHTALRHLRGTGSPDAPPRILWIDAVCINQQNVWEREKQVALMGKIYEQASQVAAWIGLADEHTVGVFAFLGDAAAASRSLGLEKSWLHGVTDKVPEERVAPVKKGLAARPEVQHLASVFGRPWFQRRWIIQEVVLSKKTTMHCGFQAIDWDDMSVGVRFLTQINQVREAVGKSMHPVRTIIGQRNKGTGMTEPLRGHTTFVSLLRAFVEFQCQDPRDIIYALLSIAENQKVAVSTVLRPNYQQPLAQVFENFARLFVRYESAPEILDIFHYCGYRHATDPLDMPSWVPDWRVPIPFRVFLGGTNVWEVFRAGKGIRHVVPYTQIPKAVLINGVFIEDIYAAIGGYPDDPSPPSAAQQLSNIGLSLSLSRLPAEYFSGESFDSAVGRSVVFDDRLPMGSGADGSGPHDGLLARLSPQARAYFSKVREEIAPRLHESRRPMAAYLAGAAEALHERALLLTKGGLVGVGPRLTKPGDKIYIFAGAESPFVLRPTTNGLRIVGECYVHGMMDGIVGEAVQRGTMKEGLIHIV